MATNASIKSIGNIQVLFLILFAFQSYAQDQNALVLTDDAKYFSFWSGNWVLLRDDGSVDSTTFYNVKHGVHEAAYAEEWQMGPGNKSIAIRAWDKTNSKWGFVWVSSNGLFQVWDTRKVGKDWYIYKEFDVNGDKYMSRQGFLLQADGTVLRISEKSYDGIKWELRFKQILKKVS